MPSIPRTERRSDTLSKERIVAAATAILDEGGEAALTFRALSTRLATGSGAIYWHVASKDELLAATADAVIAEAMSAVRRHDDPRERIRRTALDVFDAIDGHPWIGAQLSQEPFQPAVQRILEGFGEPLDALGVPQARQFDCASALLNYVSGLAAQYAAGARLGERESSRADFLGTVAGDWSRLDADRFPFLRRIAPQLADHDDREQFLAGIDLILTGITAGR